jgi:hypothetical protein
VVTSTGAPEFPADGRTEPPRCRSGRRTGAGTLAPVFGRSRAPETEEVTSLSGTDLKDSGKGRPTPKRREQERGRRRSVAAPATRKEAYKAMRERQREERVHSMAALRGGDERHLPARDRGPVKRYARDLVDSRRSVAEFFIPFAIVVLALSFSSNTRLSAIGGALWLALVVLIVLDSSVMIFRLRRGLAKNFPDESAKGTVTYALMRSMQIRRFRLPKPRLRGGRGGRRRTRA